MVDDAELLSLFLWDYQIEQFPHRRPARAWGEFAAILASEHRGECVEETGPCQCCEAQAMHLIAAKIARQFHDVDFNLDALTRAVWKFWSGRYPDSMPSTIAQAEEWFGGVAEDRWRSVQDTRKLARYIYANLLTLDPETALAAIEDYRADRS